MNQQPGEGHFGGIVEIDANHGSILWSIDLQSSWDGYSTSWVPSISNNIAIACNRSNSLLGYNGINLNTHKILWTYACPKPTSFPGSFTDYTAATDGLHAFIVCSGFVRALDLFNGNLTRTYTCSNCGGQPIITNDTVIINSDDGVKIFDKVSMELIQTLDISGMIALSENKLFVTDESNNVIRAYLFNVEYSTTTTSTTSIPTPSPVTLEQPTKGPISVVNDQQTIYHDNGFNSSLVVCMIIFGAIILIVGILIRYAVIKHKLRKEMAQVEGEGEMVASVDNDEEPGSTVMAGEGMQNMLLNQ